ncbi:MAG TPA: SDR family NAD(P)-dependent oxidoreductase [Terriglobia bacterium]|nr:SDR family NAD(P)-dependent oxidoreductase [Terriglobia bacterium]
MQMHANTIFITGGTSGIGRGLAEAFHTLGNQVIISGRREDRLQDICASNPGMRYFMLDVRDPEAIRTVARNAVAEFPSLNCVFNNAGVQRRLELAPGTPLDEEGLRDEINTNVLGVIRVAGEFIPHLTRQSNAVLLNVSSRLAFVPLARFPVYCATKAAVHSYTLSLRQQLKASGVKVIELIPPYVATELGGPWKSVGPGGPQPMPLETFIAQAMLELADGSDEVAIGDAKHLVAATNSETLKKVFAGMNR